MSLWSKLKPSVGNFHKICRCHVLHVICIGMYAITIVRVSGKSKGLGWRCSTTSNKGDRISAYLALTPVETRWTGLVFWYLNTRRLGVMHSKRVLRWYSSFVPSLDRERSSLFCSPLKQVACVFAQHAEETKQNKKKNKIPVLRWNPTVLWTQILGEQGFEFHSKLQLALFAT